MIGFTHKMLIPIAYKWVLKTAKCGVAFKELNSNNSSTEYPDVIGFQGSGFSVLVEVKVSRTDFLCDKKKSFRINPEKGMGSHRYYMCPDGLIKPHELPEGWGLIYVNLKGVARTIFKPGHHEEFIIRNNTYKRHVHYIFQKNIKAEHELMYSALRRLHIKGHIESIYDKEYVFNHKD